MTLGLPEFLHIFSPDTGYHLTYFGHRRNRLTIRLLYRVVAQLEDVIIFDNDLVSNLQNSITTVKRLRRHNLNISFSKTKTLPFINMGCVAQLAGSCSAWPWQDLCFGHADANTLCATQWHVG